jgi:SAM-dependent methyltransferase
MKLLSWRGNLMTTSEPKDLWASGASYESYVGRWSRLVAREFVQWLTIPPHACWLDIGCGTGALSQIILEMASPQVVRGVDTSEGYLAYARQQIQDPRADFLVGDATALPVESATSDAVVSGLVLNFVAQPDQALREMVRAVRKGGTVAAYVWDYAGQMQLIRFFWDAATALDPEACALDEGQRFPLCQPEPLRHLFQTAGLLRVEVRSMTIPTTFHDFDDYWTPFLRRQGPAPFYVRSLSEAQRGALQDYLRAILPFEADGSLHLIARAWAVRGVREP